MISSDNQIIQMLNERNESAIAAAKATYGGQLRALAYRFTGDAQVSEECENDTYLAMWNSIPPANPEGHLFAYLGKIIRNKAIDFFRANKPASENCFSLEADDLSSLAAELRTPESVTERQQLLEAIQEELRKCSKRNRMIFLQRYWYGLSLAEIGAQHKMKTSAVGMVLARTKEQLKVSLAQKGWYE